MACGCREAYLVEVNDEDAETGEVWPLPGAVQHNRSEERRVGKECRL